MKIKNYPVEEVNSRGVDSILNELEEKLNDCDMVYVSFDVDSMDPGLTSHGTGTPVNGGLTPDQARTILQRLAQHPKTVCLEFVEVNPCLDEKVNKMAEVTAELVEAVVDVLR